jgi:hypothetical protein
VRSRPSPIPGVSAPGKNPDALLFPARSGGPIDLHNFREREWRPALIAGGFDEPTNPFVDVCGWITRVGERVIRVVGLGRLVGRGLRLVYAGSGRRRGRRRSG